MVSTGSGVYTPASRSKRQAKRFYRKICHILTRPSFEGYFASKSGAFALSDGHLARSESTKTCGELQFHLQRMVSLLRPGDVLRMAVRVESQIPRKKRYLALVTDGHDQFSAILGIDWVERPTIGLVLPIFSSSNVTLDGDGGFHITSATTHAFIFKPVSVQMLWSAIHVTSRAIEVARCLNYFPGGAVHNLVAYYRSKVDSDAVGISEWNLQKEVESNSSLKLILSEKEEEEQSIIKRLIKQKLREVMLKVDLDDVTSKEIRTKVEDEINMDLTEYKEYVDTEMLTILGQMDSASKILDYLYLGSEWNASNYDELVDMGIGYVLNVTREIDNFFPGSFTYYNVRVWDIEEAELLHHWDHTYRFINEARKAGAKVLVHCRMGISRSASTVIAYLMKAEGWSLTHAMEHVRSCRNIIQPNPGFQKQLIIYEGILNSSRNRFSALFRQRSKSDMSRSLSAVKRRQMFKKTRSSREVDDEDESTKGSEPEAGSTSESEDVSPRPKSWSGSLSPVDLKVDEDNTDRRLEETVKSEPGEKKDISSSNVVSKEPVEVDKLDGNAIPGTRDLDRTHRLMNRARTLPMDAVNIEAKEEEGKETVGELPDISKRRGYLKRQVTDADLDSLISVDVKELNENMIMQAFKASEMKTQLIRSLEQVGRSTKHKMDEEFSVESIIMPSSLRKLSKTRRLSAERRRSMSEQDRPEGLRHRSFTEVPYKGSQDVVEPFDVGLSAKGKAKTLPVVKSGKKDARPSDEGDCKGCKPNCTKAVSAPSCDSPSPGCQDTRESVVTRTQSRYKAFLLRSRTNVKEDSRRRTLDDRQLRKGLGELFKSRDIQMKEKEAPKEEELVIKRSQFTTVEESRKQIEARVRQFSSRNLRSPRRRTVGESELRFKHKSEVSSGNKLGLQGDVQVPVEHDNPSECLDTRRLNSSEGPSSSAKPSRGQRNTRNCEEEKCLSLTGCPSGCAEVLIESGLAEDAVSNEGHQGVEDCDRSDVPASKEAVMSDDEISVRELVKFHSEVIHQKTSPPSSSSSPTEGSSPTRISPITADPSDLYQKQETTDCGTRNGRTASPTAISTTKSSEISLNSLALKGIVKKRAETFDKASLSSEPPFRPRRTHTLPKGKKPYMGLFKSLDCPPHKPLLRGKSLPTSKSEGEVDFNFESILCSQNDAKDLFSESEPSATIAKKDSMFAHLSPPDGEECTKSAPTTPGISRRNPLPDSLIGRSSSFDNVQVESFQLNVQSSMPFA